MSMKTNYFYSVSFMMMLLCVMTAMASTFQEDFIVRWAASNVRFVGGNELQLMLDQNTGSGFASRDTYLFGRIDMQIKLVPGDSAGTVTAYYLSSETANHDELDFEFLGNVSGQPYILQTNVFSNGQGGREQRIYLWFDPSAEFHTYSIIWTEQRIWFLVEGIPIRVFSNNEAVGVPYLNMKPMSLFSSIFNGDQWATEGGRVKINWEHAPFVASYRNFRAVAQHQVGVTDSSLDAFKLSKLAWVKKNFMVYDYCTDRARYPTPPPECIRIV
ncbi:hypothetical protein KP509_13G025400 [Ceratopteris richardii]|uniref:Xyloglucan endotransglucosylase/hydrolase n=1 Tax=Ceratopteris richardii TaxID=49495 RepID=A0A8T2TCA5_CERRI|nr:hypothetical protein KP509_13G025400 [Ceratopteris richardii]